MEEGERSPLLSQCPRAWLSVLLEGKTGLLGRPCLPQSPGLLAALLPALGAWLAQHRVCAQGLHLLGWVGKPLPQLHIQTNPRRCLPCACAAGPTSSITRGIKDRRVSMERLLPRTALLSLYHELAGGSQPSALQELGPSRPPCCLAGRQAWRLPRPSPALSGHRVLGGAPAREQPLRSGTPRGPGPEGRPWGRPSLLSPLGKQLPEVQLGLQCCGVSSYRDWTWNLDLNCSSPEAQACSLPASCCLSPGEDGGAANDPCGFRAPGLDEGAAPRRVHLVGCGPPLRWWLRAKVRGAGAYAIAVVAVQGVELLLAARLVQALAVRQGMVESPRTAGSQRSSAQLAQA
ncbi:tetraspanin-10 isoform X2 [Ailuropoda melanoleuca]|uniref:tetraspanin-10 isoform X2 n=1 Tax=Ailuropoda melanoleuca TaxID=9646 RepID=UPI001494B78C|nr:tetraspanin-10 isoform X2 [Ailuropoda melanoleuca]XP_034497346.1 tetraspanin-10 isoform X2 [Ailuropoda melanoleuca]